MCVIYTMDIHCICDICVSMHIHHIYDISKIHICDLYKICTYICAYM